MHGNDMFRFRRRRRLIQTPVEPIGRQILRGLLPRSRGLSRQVCTVLPPSEVIPPTRPANATAAPRRPIFPPENRASSSPRVELQDPELGVVEPSDTRSPSP